MKLTNLGLFIASPVLLVLAWTSAFGSAKEVKALAARIDRQIEAGWDKEVKPAGPADDAEFFRRVHLDLAGRIPSIVEIRDFLDDPRPDKRALWVERILQSAPDDPSYRDAYCTHFAIVWRTWLLPHTNQQAANERSGFELWLRQRLKANLGYDQMVRELLTQDPIVYTQRGGGFDGSATAFFLASDLQPENLAASTSRLFLGVKLECAQCHAHPFARWTREQFWEFAAFFADLPSRGRTNPAAKSDPHDGIKIMGTDKLARARFLDGTAPRWKNGKTRPTLADWMTASDNPYFARAAVNRLWAYFFGVGLVEQLDAPSDAAASRHAALLDELAQAFAASQYDLKFLIGALVRSQAYQRTSAISPASLPNRTAFARMPLRGLSSEQLFDSLAVATECSETASGEPSDDFFIGPRSPRSQFLAKFPSQDEKVDYQVSLLQALYLMNNDFIARQTSLRKNQTLATLAEQQTSTERKVESLYLVVLSRKPRPVESKRFVAYVDAGDAKSALADVFWILLNSAEFLFNH